jgi:phenylacetate-CoA ligase
MLSRLKKTYYALPSSLLRVLDFLPIEYKFGGRRFTETLSFILESDRWTKEKLEKYQASALNRILSYAVRTVPFYENIKLDGNVFEDIKKFPIIRKDDLLQNFSKLVSRGATFSNSYVDSTGGSSGRQLRFLASNSQFAIEWAFLVALWKRIGYGLGDRIMSFRGGSARFGRRFWRPEPAYNAVAMSPSRINPSTFPVYVEKMRKWKPKFLHGYPSAMTVFSKLVLEKRVESWPPPIPPVKGVLLCSEKVYPSQRELIENAFKARTLSWYGQSEKVILAGECEFSREYHIFPQYGFTEFLGKDGSTVEEGSEDVELVGTSFFNFAMPLIRYKTEDYATLSKHEKCRCRRNYPLLENVRGSRLQEMVVGENGSLIPLVVFNLHGEELDKVYALQYFQDQPGQLVVRIKPSISFEEKDRKNLIQALKEKVGDELAIIIQDVSEIELTPMGKAKLLVQKLDLSEWWNLIGVGR